MNPALVLDLVNVFFAGMLAGIEFVIHYGLRAPAEVLDEQSQIQLRQALVLSKRDVAIILNVPQRGFETMEQIVSCSTNVNERS